MSESKHKESAKPAEQPVDFAVVFHAVSDPTMPWPPAVAAWGNKSEANQCVLDAIRDHTMRDSVGIASPLVQMLIGEVVKAVKG